MTTHSCSEPKNAAARNKHRRFRISAEYIGWNIQKIILSIAWAIEKLVRPRHRRDRTTWIIGTSEVASMVFNLSTALQPAISVCLTRNRFYALSYDYEPLDNTRLLNRIRNLVRGPWLLARLARKYEHFLFVGNSGFLKPQIDGRDYEFRFLRKSGCTIACIFTGSEIRSRIRIQEFAAMHDIDVITTYQFPNQTPEKAADAERKAKDLARSADRYAATIFNANVDQMSYLEAKCRPFPYIVPDSHLHRNDKKFEAMHQPVILHAPSSPLAKGTPLVRAAIKQLQEQGLSFRYVELVDAPNEVVLRELGKAHIVLNEFYAFLPGMFGIEAMAKHCALLTSADPAIETSLGLDCDGAWLITRYWQLHVNLERLLLDHSLIRAFADAGFEWVEKYCRSSVAGPLLRAVLDDEANKGPRLHAERAGSQKRT